MFVTQDFKRKTIFNQRRSAAWCPEGFLRQVLWKMIKLREGFPINSSCSFGVCPNEVVRALPKFFVHFSQTVYIGSIWGWGGRGTVTPAKNFWHVGVKKKWYKLSKFWGGGVEVIWTKSKRTATFFQTTTTLLFWVIVFFENFFEKLNFWEYFFEDFFVWVAF